MTHIQRLAVAAGLLALTTPAFAHVGVPGHVYGFSAGFAHPLGGLDHIAAMMAVGLWAALKGGRALWAWPATFVGVMLAGGALGMADVVVPFVEPGILASLVTLGLMVALAADVPVVAGAVIIAVFALLHGYAHGAEVSSGAEYMAGFAVATAALHLAGIGLVLALARSAVRIAGAACALLGAALVTGVL